MPASARWLQKATDVEKVKRADELHPGDELKLEDGTYVQVRGVNMPGTDWNPHKTVVHISLGSTSWHSWPASKRVTVILGKEHG